MLIEATNGYMDSVKTALLTEPDVYTRFLDLLEDFCQKRLDEKASGFVWEEVAEEVSRFVLLFRNHPRLILGFNLFLPTGMKLSMVEDLVYISYNGETKLIEDKKEEEQAVEKKASSIVEGDDYSSDESINDDWDVVDERSEAGIKETLEEDEGDEEKNELEKEVTDLFNSRKQAKKEADKKKNTGFFLMNLFVGSIVVFFIYVMLFRPPLQIFFHSPNSTNPLKCSLLETRPIEGRRDLMEFVFQTDFEQPRATVKGDWGQPYLFLQYSFLINGNGSSASITDWNKPQTVTKIFSKVFNIFDPKDNEYEMEIIAGLQIITKARIYGEKNVAVRYNVDCNQAILEEKERLHKFLTST